MRFDPKDIVEHLRHNLERYPFGDGFTVFRELLQNADDAKSKRVVLKSFDGWAEAKNPLLRGPGLLLINDGEFDAQSSEGMKTFGGSVKATDQESVGRFGLGQKSVFHICDAFIAVPCGYDVQCNPFVVNPFETLGQTGDACLEWQHFSVSDAERIERASVQEGFTNGHLSLWFPLRRPGLRPKPKSNGIEASDITAENLRLLADRWRMAEILASLRHVRRIEVNIAGASVIVDREQVPRMTGYKLEPGDRLFGGSLGSGVASVGRERMAPADFRIDLWQSNSWPRTRNRLTDEEQPQTASPHGAVLLLVDANSQGGLSADWSVLLPVASAFSELSALSGARVKLLLHGCFFVDSGRKAIAGFGQDPEEISTQAQIRVGWNEALRDEIVLPLLPSVLHDAFQANMVTGIQLAELLTELNSSGFGREHSKAIASEQGLIRKVEQKGNVASSKWSLVAANADVRPLPVPNERGQIAIMEVFPDLAIWAGQNDLTLVAGPEAALIGSRPRWEPDEISQILLACPPTAFQRGKSPDALLAFLKTAVGSDPRLQSAAHVRLLSCLRLALLEHKPLASREQLRSILDFLPNDTVIALPSKAGGDIAIRSALASAKCAPVCIDAACLPDGTEKKEISLVDAEALLSVLQPFFVEDKTADIAGTASLAIVKLIRRQLVSALGSPKIAQLAVLRSSDGSGTSKRVSLQDLSEAASGQCLFRGDPRVNDCLKSLAAAAPNSGAMVVAGNTADLLNEIGSPFEFANHSNESFAKLVLNVDLLGDDTARAEALEKIYSPNPSVRAALRFLAVGDRRATDTNAKIYSLPGEEGELEKIVHTLIEASDTDFLIPNTVLRELKHSQASGLGVETMDGPRLGRLLNSNVGTLSNIITDKGVIALLESGASDQDIVKLPIYLTTKELRKSADELYRQGADWTVPDALKDFVDVLKPIQAQKAAQRIDGMVREWTATAQIDVILNQSEPQCLAQELLDAVVAAEDPSRLGIKNKSWVRDVHGRAFAPVHVLDLPDEISGEVRKVFDVEDIEAFVLLQDLHTDIREHSGFHKLKDQGFFPDQATSIKALLDVISEKRLPAIFGEIGDKLSEDIKNLAKKSIELPSAGWLLFSALVQFGDCDPSDIERCFSKIAEDDVEGAVSYLNAVADLAVTNKHVALRLYEAGFKSLCDWSSTAVFRVMDAVRAPVRSGEWRLAKEVAARADGISDQYRLTENLERFWEFGEEYEGGFLDQERNARNSSVWAPNSLEKQELLCAQSLLPLIKEGKRYLTDELLTFFVATIGQTEPFKDIARLDLGRSEAEINQIWAKVENLIPCSQLRVRNLVELELVEGAEFVLLTSLSNASVSVPVGALETWMVVGNQHKTAKGYRLGNGYNLKLVNVAVPTGEVQASHLFSLMSKLLIECFGVGNVESIIDAAHTYAEFDQATVEDAKARLEDRLPQILAELKPEQGTALRTILTHYEDKEQSFHVGQERETRLPALKRDLWRKVQEPEASRQLLDAVRRQIESYGYASDRVIFELFQNADDASMQHSPPSEARFRVEVSQGQIRVFHWGRLINHTGPSPDEGERAGWKRDLFNMLLMNLSEKREGVTGRFGLGFKSVHLIAEKVGIASGLNISCKVHGGMLPEHWDEGRTLSLQHEDSDRRATVYQLSIDDEYQENAQKALDAFVQAGRWLPAMARSIHSIDLEGDRSYSGRSRRQRLADGIDLIVSSGTEPGRALSLELDEDTTIYLPLSGDGPTPAADGLPRLWVLAPLAENLKSGWLLNGRNFQVDPGRGSLKRGEGEPERVFQRLGEKLGRKLVDLADLAVKDWADFALQAGLSDVSPETGPRTFWTRLADLFVRDFDDEIAKHMHGQDRGYGHLVSQRPVLPTHLGGPFQGLVIASDAKKTLQGHMAEPSMLTDIADWRAFDEIKLNCVGSRTSNILSKLDLSAPRPISLSEIIRKEIGPENRITPALAGKLGRVLTDERLNKLSGNEEEELNGVLAKAKFLMTDDTWREAQYPPRTATGLDKEEKLILTFAPDYAVTHADYTGNALSLYRRVRKLYREKNQSRIRKKSETFPNWAQNLTKDAQKVGMLHYVLEGDRGAEVGRELARKRPTWLPEQMDDLRTSPLAFGIVEPELSELLVLLYPEERVRRLGIGFGSDYPGGNEPESGPIVEPSEFLEALHEWWSVNAQERRATADNEAYPDGFRPSSLIDKAGDEDREGWFTFFALAIFRTIGRTQDGAHRNFVAMARQKGWWRELAESTPKGDPEPWIARLEEFAELGGDKVYFPQWRRRLVDLYVLASWLPEYVEALQALPSQIEQRTTLPLSKVFNLSASPLWQRLGLEGAPLSQSLGIGANWLIRESVRHGLWQGEEAQIIHPYAWASSRSVRERIFEPLGLQLGDQANPDLSREIYEFIEAHIGRNVSFLGDLDLPFQIASKNESILQNLFDGFELIDVDASEDDDKEIYS